MFVYSPSGENSRNKTVKNPTKTRNITEYLLVYEISVNSGRLVTRDELVRSIWGVTRPDYLRVHLTRPSGPLSPGDRPRRSR